MPTLVAPVTAPAIAHFDDPVLRVTNTTSKRLFQRRCTWVRTCAMCGQYHGRIHDGSADVPSIQLHTNCGCMDSIIDPGETSKGYPTMDTVVPKLDSTQQKRFMGRGNFTLWQEGRVDFGDVVTRRRVRTFSEVTGRMKVPRSVLRNVKPDRRSDVLTRWFRDETGLSKPLARRAANSRVNLMDQGSALRRSFDKMIAEYPVTERELRDLFGKRLSAQVLRGDKSLRVVSVEVMGKEAAEKYLAGELTDEQARRAAQ